MERIVNGKVLSLKHFFNKSLKGKVIDGIGHHALYTLVAYEHVNTKIKTFFDKNNQSVAIYIPAIYEQDVRRGEFSFLEPREWNSLIKTDEWILDIIEYEIYKYKSKFSIKGLAGRLEIYTSKIMHFINVFCKRTLLNVMADKLTYNNYLKLERYKGSFDEKNDLARNILIEQNGFTRGMFGTEFDNISRVYYVFEDYLDEDSTCYDWINSENLQKKFINEAPNSNEAKEVANLFKIFFEKAVVSSME